MTDDDAGAAAVQPCGAVDTNEKTEVADENVTATKDEIFEFLSSNKKVFFKSQQIDDPELTDPEKRAIAEEIFNDCRKKFLLRFGKFLERKHLNFFQNSAEPNDEETQYLIAELGQSLKTRRRDVKNRRYAAMQAMIKAESYFSEREMMKRAPHLYEQLIGQYLTDSEKRQRDQPDEEDEEEAFSRVLLKNYDNEQMEDLRKQQEREDMSDDEDENTPESVASDETTDDELFPKVPVSYRKQWGNFEDEPAEEVPKVSKKPAREQKYVTAAEREMLRQEFLGIMYTKFLEGHDQDFDYEAVDDNAELDDLQQIGQDNEDKYFDADDEDDDDVLNGVERIVRMSEDESEDELDVYMRNLSRQPS